MERTVRLLDAQERTERWARATAGIHGANREPFGLRVGIQALRTGRAGQNRCPVGAATAGRVATSADAFEGLHRPWPLVPAPARESRVDAAVDRLKKARARVWLSARPALAATQKLEAARSADAGGDGPEHRIGLNAKRRC